MEHLRIIFRKNNIRRFPNKKMIYTVNLGNAVFQYINSLTAPFFKPFLNVHNSLLLRLFFTDTLFFLRIQSLIFLYINRQNKILYQL